MRIRFTCLTLLSLLVLNIQAVKADMYGFERISNNNVEDVSSQLFVDVASEGSGLVSFKFTNNVGIVSSISDIYFDDGVLSGMASITDSGEGVAFSQFASPGDLPEGNNVIPPFVTTPGFSADSDSPASLNGVNSSSEWVKIYFNLQSEKTFNDVISALNDGNLRIGLHVQSIGREGGSDAYINDGSVPVPGAVLLGILGMAIAGVKLRKFA